MLERYGFDEYTGSGSETVGVIGAGFAFNYAREAVDRLGLRGQVALLKVSTVNPLPSAIVRRFLYGLEGFPIAFGSIEEAIRTTTKPRFVERNLVSLAAGRDYALGAGQGSRDGYWRR